MSRLRLLCQRLLERRLLGDGEQAAALVPGALLTLSLSLLLFTAIVQARSLQDSVTLLCIACCVWCATRAFLESHDLAAASLDRAVLEPLPLPRWTLAAARAVVVASVLLISALNIALPAAILVAVKWGPDRGVLALAGALLSALTGLALAQACRVLLERLAGGERLLELEGPIRLGVGVALFGVLFSAPDPTALAAERPWLESLPPFSYAALAVAENGRAAAAASALAAATSLFLLLLTFRLAAARAGGGARRAPRARETRLLHLMRRLLVRDEERAAFDFALANQARDRAFRARVYPLFAFPFAVVLLVAARPDEPYLALMALYGAAVYLTLAQTFQGYSESHGGPRLLATLPLRSESAFRIGAEKAFLVGLAAPIYLFLGVALFTVSLSGRGLPLLLGARHALVAGLFALLLCAFFFERRRVHAFSQEDRGVFPADYGGGPFLAVLLAAGMGLLAAALVEDTILFLLLAASLALAIRLTYAWKRRRAYSIRSS